MDANQALLTAAAVHAGFQATITLITYPMLVATPAAAGSVITGTTTAFRAAPTHTLLRRQGPRPELLRRLLRADRVRFVGALLTFGGALVAAW